MKRLGKYAEFVGDSCIREIYEAGARLSGKSMAHVNSTYYGGGVAEMLASYVPLLNEAGLDAEWRLLKGSKEFFTVTKKMHNALQGRGAPLGKEDIACYEETISENASYMKLDWYDAVIIDDPQPAGLVSHYSRGPPSIWKPLPMLSTLAALQKSQPWAWRCHIDLSTPEPRTLAYLKKYVSQYDAIIVSSEKYRTGIQKPHHFITPAIDPLSDKNRPMRESEIARELAANGISVKKPIVLQVSRFDPWKDPMGVIRIFRRARRKADCQLVLMGAMASDDPEGDAIFRQVYAQAHKERGIHLITAQSDRLANALQRSAAVVVQNSLREGFGLTVTEAMWKGRPVVARASGGIPLQIDDGKNGFLAESEEGMAARVVRLLKGREMAEEIGRNAREKVRGNFLITRLVKDELALVREITTAPSIRHLAGQERRLLSAIRKAGSLLPLSFGKEGFARGKP